MRIKILIIALCSLLNIQAQDTVWLSGTNKVSFKVQPTQLFFVNCTLQHNTTTTTVRIITGVGKVLFKPDGSGYIIPVSTFKNGSFTYYITGCKLAQKELVFSTYVAPPKDTIVTPPKDTTKPIGSSGASYISAAYNWGRTIGNSSAKQFGAELIRALRTPTGVAELNGYVYFTTGLVEGNSGIMKVKDQKRTEIIPAVSGDITLNTTHIVSDGQMLFVAGFDSYGAISSAVIGIKNDAEYIFSSGKSFKCQWQDNPYKSGIHVNTAKITGLDVDATTLYVYCGSKCYQYNKVTGALISQVVVSIPTYISKAVKGSEVLEMTSTEVKYNGRIICSTPTSQKITNYNFVPKDFNTYEVKGSVCIGSQYLYVVDAGNCRTLIYDKQGIYVTQIAYLPMNYNCSIDRGNPTRVFAKELEFKVDYSNMSWTLVANWSSAYQYAGDNKVWYYLKDVVTTSAGTFAIVRLENNRDHDVVKLTSTGLLKVSSYQHPISLTIEGKVIYKLDVNGKSNFYLDDVLKESVSQINGSGYIGYTQDGSFVVYDNSKSTGNHLYWIKGGQVKSAMPTRTFTQSQSHAIPYPYGDFYPVDPNVEYAGGTQVIILGNRVFVNYVGEFFGGSGGQTNLFYEFNNGVFVKRVGTTVWESNAMDGIEAPRMGAGNSYGFGVVSVNGKTYIIYNCEHTGALGWFEF
jgi:hypothetical protein